MKSFVTSGLSKEVQCRTHLDFANFPSVILRLCHFVRGSCSLASHSLAEVHLKEMANSQVRLAPPHVRLSQPPQERPQSQCDTFWWVGVLSCVLEKLFGL